MKMIILHDRYNNEPIVVRVDAITAIQKVIDRVENREEEYSSIFVSQWSFAVKEHMDVIMLRILKAESEELEGE